MYRSQRSVAVGMHIARIGEKPCNVPSRLAARGPRDKRKANFHNLLHPLLFYPEMLTRSRERADKVLSLLEPRFYFQNHKLFLLISAFSSTCFKTLWLPRDLDSIWMETLPTRLPNQILIYT